MSLRLRLDELIRACFTGIWIETHEPDDALSEIAALSRQESWRLATWDVARGLNVNGQAQTEAPDPLAALRVLKSLGSNGVPTILVLRNFHRFLGSAEVAQTLARQLVDGKQTRTFVIVLAPVVQIPVELEKLFLVVEHELPTREQLREIACGVATEQEEQPAGEQMESLLDASSGLTRHEAEAAYSLSLVRHARLEPDAVWELKSRALTKSGLLTLHRSGADFESLGGLQSLKTFTKRALLQPSRGNSLKRPRGVLLLSPPGCGKSAFSKALGREVGRPVLILDVGNLLGSLVGQSEERTRHALRIVDAMAPCVLMIDEVEKAFSGVSGQGDSGVSARMFGTFLSWLNDHESDVFVVCTANDVSKLPPEFSRAERFDGVFFLDLPGRVEKDAIWRIYLEAFELDTKQRLPKDDQWTGAEIRACCRLAALLDLPLVQAAQHVVPVAVTSGESVDQLRSWAHGRCLSANEPGTYRKEDSSNAKSRRNIRRDPLSN